MLKFALLGSGSSGNATLVSNGQTHVLLDNGLSLKRLEERLAQVGVAASELSAVLVTHEHSDHVHGLGVLSRRHRIPLLMTEGTRDNLPNGLGVLQTVETFQSGQSFRLGDVEICSFSVSHDAADPVNYTLTHAGAKLGFATDFGHCSQLVRARLAGSHALVLESNYCPLMLRQGNYPPNIQQRISSRMGHLSNHDAAALLAFLAHDTLRLVVLVHLSQENNTPSLVAKLIRDALCDHAAEIIVAPPEGDSRFFEVMP